MPRSFMFAPLCAIVLFLAAAPEAMASMADQGCEKRAFISVKPVFPKPRIETSTGLADIKKIASDPAHTIPSNHAVTLGITRYDQMLQISAPMRGLRFRDGSHCTRLESVSVTHGYRNVAVFIAKEFPKDGCAYKHILEHEMKHVAENEALLREFSSTLKNRIEELVRLHNTQTNDDPAFTRRDLENRIRAIGDETLVQMSKENKRRQKKIDSPEEYARNNTACNGVIAETAKAFKHKNSWWPF